MGLGFIGFQLQVLTFCALSKWANGNTDHFGGYGDV